MEQRITQYVQGAVAPPVVDTGAPVGAAAGRTSPAEWEWFLSHATSLG